MTGLSLEMPYRRRRFKKTYRRGRGRYGRYRRKRRYARGRRAVKVYAMRQSARRYRFRKAIQRALNVEQKFHRTSNAVQEDKTRQTIESTSLCLVNRGSGPSDRVGAQISITAVKLAVLVTPNSWLFHHDTVVNPGQTYGISSQFHVSFELWMDTQPEAGAITDLNQLYVDSGSTLADNPCAFRNRDYTSRFRKLGALKWTLRPGAAGQAGSNRNSAVPPITIDSNILMFFTGGGKKTLVKRFKKPIVVKFDPSDDATAAVTNLGNRNLFLVSRNYSASTSQPTSIDYTWMCQIDYTDV